MRLYVQLQLQKAQKDYGGLLEQLQIQREAAAGSLNKLQQKNKEQITELQAKTENLTMELQGVGDTCTCICCSFHTSIIKNAVCLL